MQSKASTISAYLDSLPNEERHVIASLDAEVRSNLPEAKGSMKYGMPVYEIGTKMFAFNAQKNYFSVYADPALVQKYKADLQGLDVGKSCIRFRSKDKLPIEFIRKVLKEMKAADGQSA